MAQRLERAPPGPLGDLVVRAPATLAALLGGEARDASPRGLRELRLTKSAPGVDQPFACVSMSVREHVLSLRSAPHETVRILQGQSVRADPAGRLLKVSLSCHSVQLQEGDRVLGVDA